MFPDVFHKCPIKLAFTFIQIPFQRFSVIVIQNSSLKKFGTEFDCLWGQYLMAIYKSHILNTLNREGPPDANGKKF